MQVTFEKGLHVIYGESGSGKTSFLNRISGHELSLQRENFSITDLEHPGESYVIFQNPDHQIIGRNLLSELAFTAECSGLDPSEIEKIVADGLKISNFDHTNIGKHLSPAEFNKAMETENSIVVDVRNFYESEVGRFDGAITTDSETFRESLPKIKKILENNKKNLESSSVDQYSPA